MEILETEEVQNLIAKLMAALQDGFMLTITKANNAVMLGINSIHSQPIFHCKIPEGVMIMEPEDKALFFNTALGQIESGIKRMKTKV